LTPTERNRLAAEDPVCGKSVDAGAASPADDGIHAESGLPQADDGAQPRGHPDQRCVFLPMRHGQAPRPAGRGAVVPAVG
jgi:hypothetical protein